MFEDQELDCVFLETNMSLKKRYHMVYECIPLPKEVGDMAPIYFKKAIMESDEEWAMNKKLIDLSAKDIRKSVPKGLPYFSVDFGLQGGFAHVIEDEHKFPRCFGKVLKCAGSWHQSFIWAFQSDNQIRHNENDVKHSLLYKLVMLNNCLILLGD
uniref:CWF19-like protein 2 n=1 Tax=Sphenodon punctatus TaxID=8508 RepID=A0A8D0H720_SPHPU